MRHYEDLAVGESREHGTYEVTREEIVEFAERYDPQPMHLGGEEPIASGWHTCAACMRLLVEGFLTEVATIASPGVNELRWPAPVRPGDELSIAVEVLGKRISESRSDRGVVRAEVEGRKETGETVVSMEAILLVERRADGEE